MKYIKQILLSLMMIVSMLALTACEDSSPGQAVAPAPEPMAEAALAEGASEGFDISTVEKAEGVVYQDEIYANWPYN